MKNNKSSQSSIEYLITYTIAILIVVLILTVLINIIFKPAPQQTLPSICNINPSFQCAGAMLVNSTSTTPAIYYLEFTNKMSEPILLSSSALNLTSLGTSSSISVKGNCYPSFVASGGEVICKVLLNSTTVPSTGTKTTSNFALSYHICSNLSTSSCSQTTYTTSGSSIQTVGPSKTTFYSVAINIEGVNSIGAVVSTNGSVLINGVPYINGQNALITKAGNYKIYATPPNGFNFTSWSLTSPNSLLSSTTSQSTTITINSNSTLTAKFTKIVVISYYNLNVFANLSVGGIVAPSSNRYKEGSIVTLSALANNGYYFTNWIGSGSGSYSGTSNTPTITINNNINETATFKPFNPVYVTFNSESNPTMQDTGSATILDVAGILFTLSNFPKTIIFAHNSIITYKFESPIAGASSTQYVFNYIVPDSGCTTDGLTQQSGSFTASSNCIANANYTTQYYLTTSSYPSSEGTASPSSEWVNYENTVALSATPDSGYVFTGWQCTGSGCYNGNNAIDTLTIDNPITETATFNIPLAVSISPSSATLDQGQSITIDSSPSGGKPPYSYQWFEQAPSSNVEPAVNCQSSTSQDCTFATNTAIAAGIYTYYIAVTDQMDNTIDSSNSVITLNPPLSVSISPTSATYDSGQTITLAASVSGGTSPYTYQWYNDSSGSGVAISGATYSTYSVSAGATGTFKYYVVVTDSATTPTSAQSSTGTYTVNPALSVSISPTSAKYDSGQTITLTATASGGTPNYSYQWYNDTSGTATAISGATSSTLSMPASLCSLGNPLSITLTNSQSSATSAPFQQRINITESNFGSCLQYNNNFADFEYTYTNGTTIPAWIESNQSGKLITWLNLKNGIPADSNIIIDLKFEPNTNLLSSSGTSGIGEAPQLSSTYGEYDDGGSVFLNYFSGASLTGWTTAGTAGQTTTAPSGNPVFGADAFYANGATGDYLYTIANGQSNSIIIEFYGYTANLQDLYFLANSNGYGQMMRDGNGGSWYGIIGTSSWTSWGTPPDSGSWSNEWVTGGIVIKAGFSTIGYLSVGVNPFGSELGSNPTTGYISGNNGNYLGLIGDGASGSTTQYWSGIIIRAYPPSGVMPSVTFGSSQTFKYYVVATDSATTPTSAQSSTGTYTINPPLSVSISPAYATYDSGQTMTLTATASGGTSSYSYQWYNDTSGTATAISGATSSTYSVASSATGTFKYYVVATDSATTKTSAQSSTGTYTVNPALAVSISPTSATYDSGQTMTLTSSVSGGTSPYTYQWYNDSSGSGVAISGATSSSLSVPTSLCSFGNTLSITLTNSQSSATPAPFQQMINLTESNFGNCLQYNNNFADFEYTYTNGTVIPAWIESNQSGKLITWLNLKNGISANSNVIIDLKFEPNTNLLSSSGTTGIGEAPQLPSTYAEYDDGVSVFTNYWNFAGTSLPSGFNSLASGGTYSVSNGLTLSTPATADDYIHVFTTSQYAPAIEESYVSSFTNLNDGEYDIAYTPVETGAGGDMGYYTAYRFSNYDDNAINKERLVEDVAGKGLAITRAKFTALSSFIISGFWPATGNEYMQINYANTLSTIDANITHANSNLDLFLFTVNPTAITTTITWLRTRAYPPSGEMPSVIFGSQQVFKYYIVATDSATTKASAQSSTGTYTVNPALAVSISPTSATYNSGQTQTISFTSTVLGGTSPYTYQWYNDSSGNAVAISGATSSSLSVPASLCSFGNPLSITLTNSQSSATPAPFQQMINLTESNFGNCLQYNNNFADFEYTYTNGTVIPAWIESNQSGKLITWLNLKNGIPANSNVIIDLKFEPNTNLLSSSGTTGIGEAAQLSSTYAEYDNIANVMQPGLIYQVYYDPTGTCDNTNYQDNISASFLEKEFTIFSCTFFISYTNPFTTNQIGTTQDVNGNSQPNVVLNYQEGYSGGAAYPNPPVSNNAYSWIIKTIGWADLPNQKVTFYGLSDDGIAMGYNTITGLSNGQYWLSGTSNPNNIYNGWKDQGATEYNGIVSPGTYAIEQDYFENGGGAYTALWSNATVNYYHASYPPNGAMPSVSFGSDSYQSFKYYVVAKDSATTPTSVQSSTGTYTVNPALTVSISPIYVTLDSGQDLTFTSSVSGGIPPYSYQWYGVSNGTATAISGETSSSITFTAPSATTTYKYYVYVVVTDSATTPTSVQSPTGAYTTEPALSVSISPTSATYDSGQTMTLTSSVSGGIPPYSYQWYNDTSGTATAISGATSSTYSVSAGATGTFKYYVVAKDSATTPTSAQSSTGTYTVNPALSVSISPTSETYNAGPKPVISIISTVSGGTSPYTYQWYNDSSGSGVAISGATSNVINISTGEVKNREVNIIITNSQSSATPAPFQQLLAINSSFFSYDYSVEAGNLQNIYFTYTNGTIIPSWLEAGVLANGLIISSYGNASLLNQSVNTKYWLNLKNGIPANSAITIEMHFASKSTNEFNNQNIGEAPQLSSTYAEYDDGGDVFNFYSNFRGNTLNTSKWTIYGAPSITIDNGLTLAATSGSWMGIYNSISYNPQLYVNDFYAYFTGLDSSNGGPTKTIGWEPGGLAEPSYNLGDASTTDYTLWNYNGAGAATTIAGGTTSTYQIWNLWATSAASYLSLNYGTPVSSSTDFTASTSSEIGIGGAVNTGNSIKVQWFRLRAYPPSGVMPSISFEPYIVNYYVVAKDSATTPTSAQSSTGTYTVNINNAQPQ